MKWSSTTSSLLDGIKLGVKDSTGHDLSFGDSVIVRWLDRSMCGRFEDGYGRTMPTPADYEPTKDIPVQEEHCGKIVYIPSRGEVTIEILWASGVRHIPLYTPDEIILTTNAEVRRGPATEGETK